MKAEALRVVEKKPASKSSASKREPSDMFKSFAKPKTSSKHESASVSTGTLDSPTTENSVGVFSAFDYEIPNGI